MSAPSVVIAGAGIAGLTAALAFARRGLKVTLIERRTGFEEVGAGLQLSPNASRLLIELGVTGAARTAVSPERLEIRNWWDPDVFATMPMAAVADRFGAPFWVIKRADLQMALVDAVRSQPGVTILMDRTVVGVADVMGGLEALVTKGHGGEERIPASLVVAADGGWSTLRAETGDLGLPRYTGYEAWRTLIPLEVAPEPLRRPIVNLWLGHRRHAVHYPVASGQEINLVLVRATSTAREPGEDWSQPPDEAELGRLSEGGAALLKALIAAAPSWRRWPLFDRPPAPMAAVQPNDHRPGAGRLALIGDAAHPVLPFMAQGAALGIEDACELAALVAPALLAGNAQARLEGLARFDRIRRPRAARIQQIGRQNGHTYHLPRPLSSARDMIIRHLGPEGMLARHGWIYSWKGDKAD